MNCISSDKQSLQGMIIGRQNEISKILEGLEHTNKKTIRLVLGEAGIGKSMILDEINSEIRQDKGQTYFVGYYNRKNALRHEHEVTYPLDICLADLITLIKETQSTGDKIESFANRLKRAFLEFARDEGVNVAEAIVGDLAKKAGLEQTVAMLRRFYDKFKDTKQSVTMVEEYVSQRPSMLRVYLGLFKTIAKEFDKMEFVLIFDSVELLGKSSIDFLIDLINFLPDRFHLIIGIQTYDRRWSDRITRKVIEDTIYTLVEMGAKEMRLEGLSPESIGEWIKKDKNKLLPLQPDLHRIRERSAGLPLLISEWLKVSKDLYYDEIDINNHCKQIIPLKTDLQDEEQINIDKLCVSFYPIDEQIIVRYLKFKDENPDLFYPFMDRLVERGIFERESGWFRHRLIQKCFDDNLHQNRRKRYHLELSNIYDILIKKKGQENIAYDTKSYWLDIGYAYHIYNSENHRKSFLQNLKVARYAAKIGDLDIAERCYGRCLESAKHDINIDEDDKMDCLFELMKDVYMIWGRYNEAYQQFQKLLIFYVKAANKEREIDTLRCIGNIHFYKGNPEKAIKYYQHALKLSRGIGYEITIAHITANLGLVHYHNGEYDEAMRYTRESLQIAKKLKDEDRMVWTLQHIAGIYFDKGDPEQAMKQYQEVLKICRDAGIKTRLCEILASMGSINYFTGNYGDAMVYLLESLELSRKSGYQGYIAGVLNIVGLIHCHNKEYDQAKKCFEESLDIARKIGHQRNVAYSLKNIGLVYYYRGKSNNAKKCFEESLEIARKIGHQYNVINSLNNIGLIYCDDRKYDQAKKCFEESLEIARKTANPWNIVESLSNLGQLYAYVGKHDQAMIYYHESLEISRRINYRKYIEDVSNKINDLRR